MQITWQEHCAAIVAMGQKRSRAWRIFMRRTIKLAAIADPRTGGNEMLIHNWGNEAARLIWSNGWKRWRAYSAECDRRYNAAMHRGRSIPSSQSNLGRSIAA